MPPTPSAREAPSRTVRPIKNHVFYPTPNRIDQNYEAYDFFAHLPARRGQHGRRSVRRVDDVQRVPPETRVADAPSAPAAPGVSTARRHDGIRAARARPHGHAPPPSASGHGHAPAPPPPSQHPGPNPTAAARRQADTDRRSSRHVSDAGHVHRAGHTTCGHRQRRGQRAEAQHQTGNGHQLATGRRSTIVRYILYTSRDIIT